MHAHTTTHKIDTISPMMFIFSTFSCSASPDVMIDAAVAERCQSHPLLAADLQSLCWGALSVGGILGCTIVGPLEVSPHSIGLMLHANPNPTPGRQALDLRPCLHSP
jgi:hypothetical protein